MPQDVLDESAISSMDAMINNAYIFIQLCVELLTKLAMKFAFDSTPEILLACGMAYSNQSVAEIMAL